MSSILLLDEAKQERYFLASQWQLARWRFFKHKMAVIALVILAVYYLVALFAEFVAPYDPHNFEKELVLAPPQLPRFIDDEGRYHLRPFVYRMEKTIDQTTWQISYAEVRSERYPIHLLVRGEPYKLWSLIPGDLHLFGTREGVFSPLGRDRGGRDLLSRIIHSGRVSVSIGLLGVAVSAVIGIAVGGISGYYGGRVDLLIQRTIRGDTFDSDVAAVDGAECYAAADLVGDQGLLRHRAHRVAGGLDRAGAGWYGASFSRCAMTTSSSPRRLPAAATPRSSIATCCRRSSVT